MEEDMINIEELEYFNPFYRIKDQYTDLINSDFFFSDLNKQQQIFLYMACYDYLKKDVKDYDKDKITVNSSYKTCTKTTRNNHYDIRYLYQLQRFLDQITSSTVKFPNYSKEIATELNNRIKKIKADIKNYINDLDKYHHNAILYEYLDGINIPLEKKEFYKNKIPNIFYLQDIIRTFRLFKNLRNKQHIVFKDWNKAFNIQNDNEMLNFQGCLGLLLMNEFCKYYHSNQLNYCILPITLMTNLCINSPVHKKIERKYLEELKALRQKVKKTSETNATNAHQKAYKGKTVTEREYVFKEAKNLMNGKNKESFYHKDGRINMSKLVKEIQNKRVREEKEIKTEKSYIEWLTNDEYIEIHGNWHN